MTADSLVTLPCGVVLPAEAFAVTFDCWRRGISLTLRDRRLSIWPPKRITVADLRAIRRLRAEIIVIVDMYQTSEKM